MKNLVITGCGIKALSHINRENQVAIEQADIVFYLVNEPVTEQWIKSKSKRCQSLYALYHSTDARAKAYIKISDHVLESFKVFNNVCVVVYGHPLLLSNPIDRLISQAGEANINLTITPAISSFDCLLADLKIDPFWGCISIEANALIKEDKHIDNTYHLIIWQIGIINDNKAAETNGSISLGLLINKLLKTYEKNHECIIYEASIYPHIQPKIIRTRIGQIDLHNTSRISTLYIPPK